MGGGAIVCAVCSMIGVVNPFIILITGPLGVVFGLVSRCLVKQRSVVIATWICLAKTVIVVVLFALISSSLSNLM